MWERACDGQTNCPRFALPSSKESTLRDLSEVKVGLKDKPEKYRCIYAPPAYFVLKPLKFVKWML